MYIKFDLGLPVSTLGGCAELTLGGDEGTSGRMMYGPKWYLCTLRWIFVVLFPSSYSMILGRSAGIGLVRIGRTWGGRGAYLVIVFFVEGPMVGLDGLQPWKNIWELINSYHLGVANVIKWSFGCWVMQGMGQLVRHNGDIYRGRIVRERIIVRKNINTVWITLSSCFSNVYAMAHIVLLGRTEIPYF